MPGAIETLPYEGRLWSGVGGFVTRSEQTRACAGWSPRIRPRAHGCALAGGAAAVALLLGGCVVQSAPAPSQSPSVTAHPQVAAGLVESAAVHAYSVTCDSLTVFVWGRPGEEAIAHAEESTDYVVITAQRWIPDAVIEDMRVALEAQISLAAPLGSRRVVDSEGDPIARTPSRAAARTDRHR